MVCGFVRACLDTLPPHPQMCLRTLGWPSTAEPWNLAYDACYAFFGRHYKPPRQRWLGLTARTVGHVRVGHPRQLRLKCHV